MSIWIWFAVACALVTGVGIWAIVAKKHGEAAITRRAACMGAKLAQFMEIIKSLGGLWRIPYPGMAGGK